MIKLSSDPRLSSCYFLTQAIWLGCIRAWDLYDLALDGLVSFSCERVEI